MTSPSVNSRTVATNIAPRDESTGPIPRLRGRFHQVAFFLAIPAGLTLVLLARTVTARAAAIVYAVSLAALFGVSAAYHRLRWSSRFRRAVRRADHSMIYLLIAGTTTPVSLLALPTPWSLVLLITVWVGAAAGIALKLIRLDGFGLASGLLYLGLGWAALAFTPLLINHAGIVAFGLVVLGGVLYTTGAIVFRSKRPDPFPKVFGYHEVWHSFVVTASACHYVAVLLLFLPGR
jgi:hemolysin III